MHKYIKFFIFFSGAWLSKEMTSCVNDLIKCGFRIRGLVTDNHAANVGAFKILLNDYPGDHQTYFELPDADNKTYVFFSTPSTL